MINRCTRNIFSLGHWLIPSKSLFCFCHSPTLIGFGRFSNELLLSRFKSSPFSSISVLAISALKFLLTVWCNRVDTFEKCALLDLLSIPWRVLCTWCRDVRPNLSELVRSLKCRQCDFYSLDNSFEFSSCPVLGGDGEDLSRLAGVFPEFEAKKLLFIASWVVLSKIPYPRDNFSELLATEWEKDEGVSTPLSMLSYVLIVENWHESPSDGDRWLFDFPRGLILGNVIYGICKVSPKNLAPLVCSVGVFSFMPSYSVICAELAFLSDSIISLLQGVPPSLWVLVLLAYNVALL